MKRVVHSGRRCCTPLAVVLGLVLVPCTRAAADPLYPGLAALGDRFEFLINADPQMGPKDSPAGNERHLFGLLQTFAREANTMRPGFVVFDGDLVARAKPSYFDAFLEACTDLEAPAVLVHGNHDGRHPDEEFLRVQEAMCGFRRWHYSFDAGRWHFAVLPAPEQLPDRASEEALLAWLAEDLAAHRARPAMVFVHYHLLPVGLSQGEYYTLSMDFKRRLIDVMAAAGNVRYAISGHVHAGIQASIKCSWRYRGIDFIVAPSPVQPRAFGEEFPHVLTPGTRDEGYYLRVAIDGAAAHFFGRKIGTQTDHAYPAAFPEFDPANDPRWATPAGSLPAGPAPFEDSFEDGLGAWRMPHRYRTDAAPGFVWETTPRAHASGRQSLYLRCREKGNAWAYDEFIEHYRTAALPPGALPRLAARYKTPLEERSPFGGGFIRATAYKAGAPLVRFIFHWGAREERVRHMPQAWLYADHGGRMGLGAWDRAAREGRVLFRRVPDRPEGWNTLDVPLAAFYDAAHAAPGAFAALGADTMLIALGVWCGQDPGSFAGAYFDDVRLALDAAPAPPPPAGGHNRRNVYGTWFLEGHDP